MKKILVLSVLAALFTSCGLDQGVQRGYIISHSPMEELALENNEVDTELDSAQ